MVWFFLEALVALLIAVGIVAWTMGPKRRKPPRGRHTTRTAARRLANAARAARKE